MKRYSMVIEIRAEKVEECKKLHATAWPAVRKTITACHIRNYSIYLCKLPDGRHYLFGYLEYTGNDFAADIARMSADPITQEWWDVCEQCQVPHPNRPKSAWWAETQEIFHQD